MKRKLAVFLGSSLSLTTSWHCAASLPASAQDWFKTGTGLGVTKARLAAPDIAARSASSAATRENFSRRAVVRPGILRRSRYGSPSFYPTQIPSQPSEIEGGGLGGRSGQRLHGRIRQFDGGRNDLAAAGFLSDVHNPTAPLALQKIYRGERDGRRCAASRASVCR